MGHFPLTRSYYKASLFTLAGCWKTKPRGVTRLRTLCWRAENTLEWDERFNMFTEPQLASERKVVSFQRVEETITEQG